MENDFEEDLDLDFDENQSLNINNNDRIINYEPLNPTIKTLYDNWKSGDLLLQPEFQRNYVWDSQKASNLIESVLLKIPIPIIFTAEDNDIEEVIDGQQRLTSIFSYIDGKFPDGTDFSLKNLKILNELSGLKFKELEEKFQKGILKRFLSVIKITQSSNEDIKFEMFERLNTNITRLNSQELRNCMYRGEYNTFIKKLSEYQVFQEILNKSEYKKRMLDCELILMFFSFFNKNYDQYKGNMKQFLNDEMRRNRKISDKDKKDYEEVFKKSVDLIKVIFGKDAFCIYTIDEKTKIGNFESRKLNQGLYLILMYGFIPYSKNQIMPYCDLIREELINLQIHNKDFFDSLTGSGTNSKEKVIKKLEIWKETLKGIIGYPINEPRCFSKNLKEILFKDNSTCSICKQKILSVDDSEVDHINCYWKGGKTIPANAQLTHRICNRIKSGDF